MTDLRHSVHLWHQLQFSTVTPDFMDEDILQVIVKQARNSHRSIKERLLNVDILYKQMAENQLEINAKLTDKCARARKNAIHSLLPNVDAGDYVLVPRSQRFTREKLAKRSRWARRIVKAVSDYNYSVHEFCSDAVEDYHIKRLKFYPDSNLNTEAIMSHVLLSETGVAVSRPVTLENVGNV